MLLGCRWVEGRSADASRTGCAATLFGSEVGIACCSRTFGTRLRQISNRPPSLSQFGGAAAAAAHSRGSSLFHCSASPWICIAVASPPHHLHTDRQPLLRTRGSRTTTNRSTSSFLFNRGAIANRKRPNQSLEFRSRHLRTFPRQSLRKHSPK